MTRTSSTTCFLAVAVTLAAPRFVSAAVPAFPGAEGPGAVATGGRGGDVYHVTNLLPDLNATTPGSLMYGVANAPSAGRTIVFDVGGTIYLGGLTSNDTLRFSKGNVTVAGQTAPGPGITIAGTGTKWTNTNLILRNMSVRPNTNVNNTSYDCFSLQLKGSIVDHVSATWFTDEGISQTDTGTTSSVQYAYISEGLGGHGFGSLLSTEVDGTTGMYSHNLYSHNVTRMPRIGSETGDIGLVLNFSNNVIYDWYNGNAGSSGGTSQNSSTNFIGNYYIQGNDVGKNPFSGGSSDPGDTKIYQNGNKFDNNQNSVLDGANVTTSIFTGERTIFSSPFAVPGVDTVDTADAAYQRVLNYGGPNWQNRDPIDTRIANQLKNQTGANISNLGDATHSAEWNALMAQRPTNGVAPYSRAANYDTDHDGMPDVWEVAHGLSPTSASGANGNNGDYDNNGYTNLEEYINEVGAWPASNALVFTNANANGRYAQIGNWGNLWQPSRFDEAQINSGTTTVDAVGQHARVLKVAANSSDAAALSVTGGWIDVADSILVGPGGTGAVNQSGGIVHAKNAVVIGGTNHAGTYVLNGGTLATALLSKGAQGGTFTFTGGKLHADTVAFSFTNQGGTLAPGSDSDLQNIAAAGMTDITGFAPVISSAVGNTHVNGSLTLQSATLDNPLFSTLQIELASLTSFDTLSIDNALALGGILQVDLLSGYNPGPGKSWNIGTASSITGAFAAITPGFTVSTIGGNLYLQTVPEPASLVLLGLGGIAPASLPPRQSVRIKRKRPE